MNRKYFVVSPPRSGTQSLCKMAEILGLTSYHSPLTTDIIKVGDFFADTPFFSINLIRELLETPCHYFIYSNRTIREIANSWERVNLFKYYNKLQSSNNLPAEQKIDKKIYEELFGHERFINFDKSLYYFNNHKNTISQLIPKERILFYSFKLGWKPLCDFLNVPLPKDSLPPKVDKYLRSSPNT